MKDSISRSFTPLAAFAVALAAFLLVATLQWHIPMMLWDQLDMVPMVEAWQNGTLADTEFFRIRAGHIHTLAYAVLLATTYLSHGHLWLDCLLSWVLLIVYAVLVMALMRRTLDMRDAFARALSVLMIFFVLNPGHLANLQWGWQVAVFMSLIGTVVAIDFLSRRTLSWLNIGIALFVAVLAYLSFATAIALVPTALVVLCLRHDEPPLRRIICAVLWLFAGAAVYAVTRWFGSADIPAGPSFTSLLHYALNFLGAGVGRFATDLAAWIALAGLVSAAWAFLRSVDRRRSLPWLGLALFGLFSALLIAAARVSMYGPAHAFVTRYVSISSLFWIGWAGLIALAPLPKTALQKTSRHAGIALLAVFALLNAVQMTRKAARVAADTRVIAATLRETYPNVDPSLLSGLYFDQPQLTLQRLAELKALGFPPFDQP